jgi:O-antigen biosynthesis protein
MTTVAWLVPSLIDGSGGHRTILQNALYLAQNGHHTTLYLENDSCLQKGESGADAISRLFGYRFESVMVGWGGIAPANAVFATIWYSAKVVRDLTFTCQRFYFVQDWEACFNPMGDTYLFAENSYRYGLMPITIGRWLPMNLKSMFSVNARYFDFCADKSIYHPIPNVKREKSVAFIFQPEKPRRGSAMGIEALGIVKYHMPDVKIYLFGSRQTGNVWFEHEDLGLLSLPECNALYNRVQVGLCISSSNPSRIPFEMLSAGLPVVELHRENTLYDLPESACLLCDQTPESLAEGIITLLNSEDKLAGMRKAAIDFMANRDIHDGYRQFSDAFDDGMAAYGKQFPEPDYLRQYTLPPVVATPFVQSLPKSIQEDLAKREPSSFRILGYLKKRGRQFIRPISRMLKALK